MKTKSSRKYINNTYEFLTMVSLTILALLLIFFGLIERENLNQTEKSLDSTLSIASKLVDEKLQGINESMQQFVTNNLNANSFFTGNTLREDSYKLFLFYKDICTVKSSDSSLSGVYAYRYKDDLILSDRQTSALIGFSDEMFLRSLDVAYYDWASGRDQSKAGFKHISDIHNVNGEAVISICNSCPVYSNYYGWLIANVSVNALNKYISGCLSDTSIKLLVTDSCGNKLFSNMNETDTRHGSVMSMSCSSAFSGLSFYVYSSFSFGGYLAVQYYYVLLIVGCLILLYCVYSLFRFTLNKLKPLDTLLMDVNSYIDCGIDETKSDYNPKQLSSAFNNLIAENDHYRSKYGEWLAFKHTELMEKLTGESELVTDADLDEYCRYFDVALLRAPTTLAVICMLDMDGCLKPDMVNSFFDILKRTLNDYHVFLGNTMISEQLNTNEFALISDLKPKELKQLLVAYKDNGTHISIAVSDSISDFHDISANYHALANVLKYSVVYDNPLILSVNSYKVLKREHSFEAYTLVLEICSAITHFDDSWNIKLETLREKLTRSLISREELHTFLQFFIYNLDSNLNSIGSELQALFMETVSKPCSEYEASFRHANDVIDFLFVHLQDYSNKASDMRRNNSYHSLLINIEQYIRETIGSDQLSLLTISSHFNMNPSTFSTMFKKLFGEKFVDYVIRIRIQKSCRLLDDNTLSVEEIARSVGYTSAAAFSRVFKKETGYSPTDYRKAHT